MKKKKMRIIRIGIRTMTKNITVEEDHLIMGLFSISSRKSKCVCNKKTI